MEEQYWFDLDGTLWHTDAKVWVIDKNAPEKAIVKISQYEGSLIVNGFYNNDNLKFSYNGMSGSISKELYSRICKYKQVDIKNLGLSYREFSDVDMIAKQANDLIIHTNNIKALEGKHINIITARANEYAHKTLLDKLEGKLKELNITIGDRIFISDNSYAYIPGDTAEKKMLYMLQYLVGFKIEMDRFVNIEMKSYMHLHFFDDDSKNIDTCIIINKYLANLLEKTEDDLRLEILSRLDKHDGQLKMEINKVVTNELNPFITTIVKIKLKR